MARAMSSLPVPVSPSKSTVESPHATVSTICSTRRRPELLPMIPSKPVSGFTGSSIRSISSVLSGSVLGLRSWYWRGYVRLFKPMIFLLHSLSCVVRPCDSPVLLMLPLPTFSPDPFTQVNRAVLELDAIGFAIGKKLDCIPVYKCYVFQIQGDMTTGPFQLEEPTQVVNIFCLDSAAQSENDLSIRFPLDL